MLNYVSGLRHLAGWPLCTYCNSTELHYITYFNTD